MRVLVCAIVGVVCVAGTPAFGQSVALTLLDALVRAREQSPDVIVARARVDEARGRLVGARARFRENPSFDLFAGSRTSSSRHSADAEIGISQLLETGGQRAARIAGAEAAVVSEEASVANAQREALAAVAIAFLRALHAAERGELLTAAEATTLDIERIASRRYQAGDIAVLDVNVARLALSRSRSARLAGDADLTTANADLGRLLGMVDVSVVADGSLDADRTADFATLAAAIDHRADLKGLDAAALEAEADVTLGNALRKPDVTAGVSAKREGMDTVLLGGLTITFPTFNSGQELRATGRARAIRLRQQRELARASALERVRGLDAAYAIRRAAATVFESAALPSAIENEQLSQRSFEEGEIRLTDLIVVRRELIDTRLEHLDRLLEAAETAVVRDAEAGVLR